MCFFPCRPSLGGALWVACLVEALGPPVASAARAGLLATLPELLWSLPVIFPPIGLTCNASVRVRLGFRPVPGEGTGV